ncbi:pyridoxamine 5'-phosphate oxidase [Clostridium carboxidivorans P7]|uniref:Pyridoxamine 5'-phosphate oxidase-related FMN-binding n=1 Tax=Clostridium carboxidivorans P7 TaxID=536227 RepID=C6PP18_9CLOT|nr:pyridoxamine 5'-phosphate oxidase family protein [Clostridium carboxidivorans]AKN31233.1 pyridoxamine 5'-phosphate oxidase [Clostridium carboxidivorans P7]EET89096.1 pyridoxamine 5'-phosphate oxidase-related FMN-binding [Clostridium carboxidivorans P7]EFG88350.1 pyridoxamine 5'-phosphate oxidase family protein [Clostridium carboxidivorans P7]
MNEVVKFLSENPVQYLATVGRDGKAKCRPFMFCFEKDGKLWFCTNNTKDVYKDMKENPYIEISVSSPSYAWIRLNGKVVFENNMSVKEGCMNNPIVKGQYQTADNPIFEVFYLADAKAVIADFSGNPPAEYTL